MNDEYNITMSPLCQRLTDNDHFVDVEIYRGKEDNGWILEVVHENRSSTVWDEAFPTDQAAFDYVKQMIEKTGIDSLMGDPVTLPH